MRRIPNSGSPQTTSGGDNLGPLLMIIVRRLGLFAIAAQGNLGDICRCKERHLIN